MLGGSCLISVDVDICASKYIDMKCVVLWKLYVLDIIVHDTW